MFAGLAQVVACEILSSDKRNIESIPGWVEYECGLAGRLEESTVGPRSRVTCEKWPLLPL